MLDGIVVSVALPEIGDDVGLQGAELQWVTAYTLPLGAGRALAGLGAACAIPAALALTTAVTEEGAIATRCSAGCPPPSTSEWSVGPCSAGS
jgi:hypothetical protein